HRDCNSDRVLVRSRSPDLERLLGRDAIGAHLERMPANREDARARNVPRRGRRGGRSVGHRAGVYAGRVTDPDPTLLENRRATLTPIAARAGRPRSVPICSVVADDVIYSPLDEKPKAAAAPARLRRVRNLAADPRATILLDRWSEDWRELAWLELQC